MKMIGIILDESKVERLGSLTHERAISAMPIAGCYRAIDLSLSNMSNSGIQKIAVMTQFSSASLLSHLSTPKVWNLGEKHGGLFVFTPSLEKESLLWHRGTADTMYQNIEFLKRSQEEYVVITSGNIIHKINYNDMLKNHIEKGADITILAQNVGYEEAPKYGIMEIDSDNKVLEFEEKPLEPKTDIASLGVYLLKRTLLITLLETVISEGRYDFVSDVIMRYRKKVKMNAYFFDGYWSNIGTIKKYFDTNMDFLKKDVRADIILAQPCIATRPKDDAPAKLNDGAKVQNAIVGGGNILNGEVKNSVLFDKVYTGSDSVVENTIIMSGSYVGNSCKISYAILDKDVVVSDGKEIIGTPENIIVVPKGTVI